METELLLLLICQVCSTSRTVVLSNRIPAAVFGNSFHARAGNRFSLSFSGKVLSPMKYRSKFREGACTTSWAIRTMGEGSRLRGSNRKKKPKQEQMMATSRLRTLHLRKVLF